MKIDGDGVEERQNWKCGWGLWLTGGSALTQAEGVE